MSTRQSRHKKYWVAEQVRGFVKLKKFKHPRKTRIGQTTPTHPLSIFFFFLETCTTTKNNTKNTKSSPKKTNPGWGLTHPPTSEFFSDLGIFFNLTKPLKHDWHTNQSNCYKLKHETIFFLSSHRDYHWWRKLALCQRNVNVFSRLSQRSRFSLMLVNDWFRTVQICSRSNDSYGEEVVRLYTMHE